MNYLNTSFEEAARRTARSREPHAAFRSRKDSGPTEGVRTSIVQRCDRHTPGRVRNRSDSNEHALGKCYTTDEEVAAASLDSTTAKLISVIYTERRTFSPVSR